MPSTIYAVLIADVMESRARAIFAACSENSSRPFQDAIWRHKLIQLPYSVTAGDEFSDRYPQTCRRYPPSSGISAPLSGAVSPDRSGLRQCFRPYSGARKPPWRRSFSIRAKGHRKHQDRQSLQIRGPDRFCVRYEHFDKTINPDSMGSTITLVLKITERQWETIQEFLDSPTLEQTAKRLKLDNSTVSRNLKRGYYCS